MSKVIRDFENAEEQLTVVPFEKKPQLKTAWTPMQEVEVTHADHHNTRTDGLTAKNARIDAYCEGCK